MEKAFDKDHKFILLRTLHKNLSAGKIQTQDLPDNGPDAALITELSTELGHCTRLICDTHPAYCKGQQY